MALALSSRPSTPSRTSPGSFGFLNRIRSHKDTYQIHRSHNSTVAFETEPPRPISWRSSSWDSKDQPPSRDSLFSVPAQEGTGSKSRRLSVTTQDEFVVDTCGLEEEFVSASKFGLRKECGKGASATVRIMVKRGDKKGEGRKFAVKEFRKKTTRESEDEYAKKVKSEFTIAKSLYHPNIVESVRLCTSSGRWNHVMEYCAYGELFSLVDRRYLKAEDKKCIFKQVLRGVEYLHDHGVAHRDIKLENLLMTEQGHIKITDFGVSEVFRGQHPGLPKSSRNFALTIESRMSAPGVCGSRPYISPEVLAQDKAYDPSKLDVWSCGILYMTLLLNGNPWQSPNQREPNYAEFIAGWDAFLAKDLETIINEDNYPQCGRVFSALTTNRERRCIFKMLHPDPTRRCTIKEALSDRWLKMFDCCSPDTYEKPCAIDVSKVGCQAAISKMKVQAKHDHLPPPIKRMPQHKFDMGDGTSRYD